ncbi:MAG: hypothetical protein Q8O98_00910 [bacterium]|nr:hypothetical protein [bacterium]
MISKRVYAEVEKAEAYRRVHLCEHCGILLEPNESGEEHETTCLDLEVGQTVSVNWPGMNKEPRLYKALIMQVRKSNGTSLLKPTVIVNYNNMAVPVKWTDIVQIL